MKFFVTIYRRSIKQSNMQSLFDLLENGKDFKILTADLDGTMVVNYTGSGDFVQELTQQLEAIAIRAKIENYDLSMRGKALFSDRGHRLAFLDYTKKRTVDTVTVELADKWYCLIIVRKTGELVEIGFDVLEEYCPSGESPFCDHVPNPKAVQRWCDANNYELEPLSAELIIGRWEIEYKGNYVPVS